MELNQKYIQIRNDFITICKPLQNEDYSVQPAEFVSPPKWHLAHTTWFFEQFVLVKFKEGYKVFDEDFAYLFNSYYNNAGDRVLRPNRGLMTRPTVDEVRNYRAYVDENVIELLNKNPSDEINDIVELGLQHEQQHQELFHYDIKYILGHQPTFPNFKSDVKLDAITSNPQFIKIEEGIYEIGFNGKGFHFDCELGHHKVYLNGFEIRNQLVTNADYIDFIESGAYDNFNLWHAEGWDFIKNENINSPLYWHKWNDDWCAYTYDGFKKVDLNLPVSHISFYEAWAFAEWKGMRLPTEFEWEVASSKLSYGQLWEWTNSAFLPYPNFKKPEGAIGEYNGKFMVNQMVLRGASIATPQNHSRKTYRNFFHPNLRWMFSGIRLVK
ncbi:ergothioneine biosynthesis protein EgtB [Subsaxibacter sp. CAU 1640]|uniref:ergothioneine biosynthesis protein EgtB n=1 Tax=Subsaxibacter sp. CAU 1640 TaxID=2933271 RepID=UPI0020048500|nr:ergothioneine biosynthesis protein EgtB [Subsaxibacter sp. CAU 1640]MCK7589040.1 ergothioneine biosynthesis protein EgtB [Subsaxibacter sp. CAU 1640]